MDAVVRQACDLSDQVKSSVAQVVELYQDGPSLAQDILLHASDTNEAGPFRTKFIADHEKYVTVPSGSTLRVCRGVDHGRRLFVFIHGLGGTLEQFEPLLRLVDLCNESFVALDLPGFGKSDELVQYPMHDIVKTVHQVLVSENIAQDTELVLVGHSMGCYLSIHFYQQMQDVYHITQLILLSPPAPQVDRLSPDNKLVRWSLHALFKFPWIFDTYRKWFDQNKGLSSSGILQFFYNNDEDDINAKYRKLWQFHNNVQIKSRSLLGYLLGWEPINWDKLDTHTLSVVVICGENDLFTPLKDAKELIQKFGSDCKLAVIPSAGHNLCFDKPLKTCEVFYTNTQNL